MVMVGITTERNDSRSNKKARPRTKPKMIGRCCFMVRLKSTDPAVIPATYTWVPGTRATVSGMTWLRSVARAAVEVLSVPLPASVSVTMSTVRSALVVTTTGPPICPLSVRMARPRDATPARTAGVATSGAVTTTRADMGAPGNAASIRS